MIQRYLVFAGAALLLTVSSPVYAYNVDDPLVVKMVDGGMKSMLANAQSKPHYGLDKIYSGGHGEL